MSLSFVSGLRIVVKVAGFGHKEQKTPDQSIDWSGVFCSLCPKPATLTTMRKPLTNDNDNGTPVVYGVDSVADAFSAMALRA